ncbi:VPA1262 family protein [uncultured Idiomarina sp.]|uniref:VPA1262 family protein n=1 Tax=uncultured Idiomarina sp. TaxID=352961 RepID=UPI00259A4DBA|nr:VPA1262 family protein [uncultured Idiomarina sp.]
MNKGFNDNKVSTTLKDLIGDTRLARLFHDDSRPCAVQLWILQIHSTETTKNRIIYGRVVPYSHSNNSWSFSNNDKFSTLEHCRAKITRLNLYIDSNLLSDFLEMLCNGVKISTISDTLGLERSNKFDEKFGTIFLDPKNLVYKPVTYLINKDAFELHSTTSPHGAAGAMSASITQVDKLSIFQADHKYRSDLIKFIVEHLNFDTGLNFEQNDKVRFGDIEFLVFPTLDEKEKNLLEVVWGDKRRKLSVKFDSKNLPNYSGFIFNIKIFNSGQIIYSRIANAEKYDNRMYMREFDIDKTIRSIADSTELEIYGFNAEDNEENILCYRWRTGYIREINFQANVAGGNSSSVKFDWLENTVKEKQSSRVKAVLTKNIGNHGFASQVGGREADPWIAINREISPIFNKLHPKKSDARFFERYGPSDGEGRLQFVEWFKALFSKYNDSQIIIFDPYFDSAGLSLLSLYAAPKCNYIVFTSLPKQKGDEENPTNRNRVDDLVTACENNKRTLSKINLRIIGLKDGKLHDRYILIIGSDGLPIAGFNLSNSLQKVAENYPLLITPIPSDTLLEVEKYKSSLLKELEAKKSDSEENNHGLIELYVSSDAPRKTVRYEPLKILNNELAGDILSIWANEPSLIGLYGAPLKDKLISLELLEGDSLNLIDPQRFLAWVKKKVSSEDFMDQWEVVGEFLANSRAGDTDFQEILSETSFLENLMGYLTKSIQRTHKDLDTDITVLEPHLFQRPIEKLLCSSYQLHHMCHMTKYTALTWPEYFAIKLLWSYDPKSLLELVAEESPKIPKEPDHADIIRLSLLSQIVSEISLSIELLPNYSRTCTLLNSCNGLIRWMGLYALEQMIHQTKDVTSELGLLSRFDRTEKVRYLGWLVNRSANDERKRDQYEKLLVALKNELPEQLSESDLRHVIDSMRGHMRQLPWTEPWLFRDLVLPLLQSEQADTDDACKIWIEEIVSLIGPAESRNSRLFQLSREGQMTNTCAFIFAHSTPEQQRKVIGMIRPILNKQKRVLQQPLASTSNWSCWNDALVVSMWILAFTRWCQYYLTELKQANVELDNLSGDAYDLAMLRPMEEWESEGVGKDRELALFLSQAEDLISKSE